MRKPALRIASLVKVFYVGPFPMKDALGDNFTYRVELLRDRASHRYSAKIWRIEHYRVQPSFSGRKGSKRIYADEGLLVEDVAMDTNVTGNSQAAVEKKAVARIVHMLGLG